jgi:hypothetical protein
VCYTLGTGTTAASCSVSRLLRPRACYFLKYTPAQSKKEYPPLRPIKPPPPQYPVDGLPAELVILGRRFESYLGSQFHNQPQTREPHRAKLGCLTARIRIIRLVSVFRLYV